MRIASIFFAASSLLQVCRHTPSSSADASASTHGPSAHGGTLAIANGVSAEVLAQPDGRLVAWVNDARQAPIDRGTVTLEVRTQDNSVVAVPVAYDATQHAWVGRPGDLAAGTYTVAVSVQPPDAPAPVRIEAPGIAFAASPPLPAARYGGRVQWVGDHAVETVVAANGDVSMFWMDLAGNPVPMGDVQQPTVAVAGVTVPTHTVDDHLEAHVTAPVPAAGVAVGVPSVAVGGATFHGVVVPPAPVVGTPPSHEGAVVGFVPPPPSNMGVVVGAPPPIELNAGVVVAEPTVNMPPPPVAAPPPPPRPRGSVGVMVAPPQVGIGFGGGGFGIGIPGVVVGGEGEGPRGNGWRGNGNGNGNGWRGRGEWRGGGEGNWRRRGR